MTRGNRHTESGSGEANVNVGGGGGGGGNVRHDMENTKKTMVEVLKKDKC